MKTFDRLPKNKSTFVVSRLRVALGCIAVVLALAGCGQKGALYLPKEPVKQSDAK